jgi:hypothetical protein
VPETAGESAGAPDLSRAPLGWWYVDPWNGDLSNRVKSALNRLKLINSEINI